jgi:hypothetical protein
LRNEEHRGIYYRSNYTNGTGLSFSNKFPLPLLFAEKFSFLLNKWVMKVFNFLYFYRSISKRHIEIKDLDSFFYPLDKLKGWNKLYGSNGFYQIQFVLPTQYRNRLQLILNKISTSGHEAFLGVLKTLGPQKGAGLMSFSREGVTLCVDIPNRGDESVKLVREVYDMVLASSGCVYPAKDQLMTHDQFIGFFPKWEEFNMYRDSGIQSDFWKRVRGDK